MYSIQNISIICYHCSF